MSTDPIISKDDTDDLLWLAFLLFIVLTLYVETEYPPASSDKPEGRAEMQSTLNTP